MILSVVVSLLLPTFGGSLASLARHPQILPALRPVQHNNAVLVMRVGKGNSKGMGGMTKGNSIMAYNAIRKKSMKDPNKVFVGNLNFTTTAEEVRNLCEQFGEVAHVKLVKNHYTGNSKGFAFVRFCDPISATSALSTLPGTMLNGRAVVCDNVEEKEKVKERKKKSADTADEFDLAFLEDEISPISDEA